MTIRVVVFDPLKKLAIFEPLLYFLVLTFPFPSSLALFSFPVPGHCWQTSKEKNLDRFFCFLKIFSHCRWTRNFCDLFIKKRKKLYKKIVLGSRKTKSLGANYCLFVLELIYQRFNFFLEKSSTFC